MKTEERTPTEPQEPEKGHLLLNAAKLIFLVAVLVGAWFVLDWLITKK